MNGSGDPRPRDTDQDTATGTASGPVAHGTGDPGAGATGGPTGSGEARGDGGSEPPAGPPAATDPGGARAGAAGRTGADWPLWEVFVRARRGLSHTHVGSLHAPDAQLALRNARDLYTRRGEGVSLWVVPSAAITASSPDEKDPFFEPSGDKPYRHPTFYEIPEGVRHL